MHSILAVLRLFYFGLFFRVGDTHTHTFRMPCSHWGSLSEIYIHTCIHIYIYITRIERSLAKLSCYQLSSKMHLSVLLLSVMITKKKSGILVNLSGNWLMLTEK